MKTKTKTKQLPVTDNVPGEELIKKHEIEDTPFMVVTTEEGSFATLGKYRLTPVYPTKQEAIDDVSKVTWNRILQIISLVNEILKTDTK